VEFFFPPAGRPRLAPNPEGDLTEAELADLAEFVTADVTDVEVADFLFRLAELDNRNSLLWMRFGKSRFCFKATAFSKHQIYSSYVRKWTKTYFIPVFRIRHILIRIPILAGGCGYETMNTEFQNFLTSNMGVYCRNKFIPRVLPDPFVGHLLR
jgi:hypothetical protein